MKRHLFAGWCGVLMLLMLPALAFASGYGINELGTKALGMGGAFAAQADDPTAVYFNPAGIVQLDGTQVSVGVNTITPSFSFQSNGTSRIAGTSAGQTTDSEDRTFYIPNAYVTHKYSDSMSFGFGLFANFGLASDWPDDWEGRYILGGELSEIKTLSLNPVVAFRPHKRLSLAFGPVLQQIEIEIKYKQFVVYPPPPVGPPFAVGPLDVESKLTGDNWNWGWNVGLLYWITDNLKFAATYRSEVNHNITKGKAEFDPQIPLLGIQNTGVSASIKTPAIAYLGLAYTNGPWTLEFDGQWTEWSTFKSLSGSFDQPVGGQPGLSSTMNWKNTWAYRFGVQYNVNKFLDLRAGFIRDEQTVPDDTLSPLLPSGDRNIYTIGASGHFNKMTLDFAYNYLADEDRNFDNSKGNAVGSGALAGGTRVTGTFKDSNAHIFGLNLTYRF
jgi:long-chain fatty acid transport protein